jgi:glyoxylase-like metal-dependent hydrolase (beta-lactamase superfamily II)
LTAVTQLTPGTWQISLPFQGEEGIIGSYLLVGNNEVALVDPGPTSMMSALLEAIRMAGFQPQEVTHILATHIHLDHAGAAGSLLAYMPAASVFVHSKGAPHLLDTSKVVASASRIYGDRMNELWGPIEPVPMERLKVIEGGSTLNVAGRRLEIHYTPGHAVHHIIFFDTHSGELFAGDVAGVRLQDINYVRPPTPPPDLDLEAWSASIDLLRRLQPDVLYLAHFGPSHNPEQHLTHLRERLFTWGDLILNAMREGKDEAEILMLFKAQTEPELQRFSDDPHILQRYDIATNYLMTVQGYLRYWRKKHPERLS